MLECTKSSRWLQNVWGRDSLFARNAGRISLLYTVSKNTRAVTALGAGIRGRQDVTSRSKIGLKGRSKSRYESQSAVCSRIVIVENKMITGGETRVMGASGTNCCFRMRSCD